MDDIAFRLGIPTETASAAQPPDLDQWTRALEQAEQEAAGSPAGEVKVRALLAAARALWHLGDLLACLKMAIQCLADKNLDTPTSLAVHAMTLAAFALNELGATEQARILAQRALVMTRVEFLFELLPTALSCAACIDSCGGELDRGETLHMEALSHARQSGGNESLQLALGNLLMSYVELLRGAKRKGDDTLADEVTRRSRRYIVQARHLKEDATLSQWRRRSLQQTLGELLGLCGEQREGEHLLRECLAQSIADGAVFATQSCATALAEQLEARGAYREALNLLRTYVHPESPRRGSFRRRLEATRTAESCLRHLGIGEEVTRISERIARDLDEWESSRHEALRCLLDAGISSSQPSSLGSARGLARGAPQAPLSDSTAAATGSRLAGNRRK